MFKLTKSTKRLISAVAVAGAVLAGLFAPAYPVFAAQAAVNLLTADSFAVLAGAGITNTGVTTIIGNVGSFPTTSQSGFGPGANQVNLTGTNHGGDAVTQQAKNDLVTAYNDAAGRLPVTTVNTELGGTTKFAGVYDSASGTFGITGTLVLDAQGDATAVFIFKTASTLITASGSTVSLTNGAQACNVFWQVGSSATLGSGSTFKGNILALTSITLNTGASVSGRVLARNGAVTMDTNNIAVAVCSVPTPAVVTKDATNIGPTSALLCMDYDFKGVSGYVQFAYQKSGGPWLYTSWVAKSGSGTYCETVTGLSAGTYCFIPRLRYGVTELEGTQKCFTTTGPGGMTVGGEISAVNKALLLAPWLGLGLILVFGVAVLLLRRRTSR